MKLAEVMADLAQQMRIQINKKGNMDNNYIDGLCQKEIKEAVKAEIERCKKIIQDNLHSSLGELGYNIAYLAKETSLFCEIQRQIKDLFDSCIEKIEKP